jgi:hypothetical protein
MSDSSSDISTELRERLEDRSFVMREHALIQEIVTEPADPGKRFRLGQMYEQNGLLCGAAQAYQQALKLNPHNERFAAHFKALMDQGVTIDDEENIYQLPALPGEPARGRADDLIALPRFGYVHDVDPIRVYKGENDRYIRVGCVARDKLTLKSYTLWNVVFGLAGVAGLIAVAIQLVWFVNELSTGEGQASVSSAKFFGGVVALLLASLAGVCCLAFAGKGIALGNGGRIAEASFGRKTRSWQLSHGGWVQIDLDRSYGVSWKGIAVSIADAHGNELYELGNCKIDDPKAEFYVRAAAHAAYVLQVPLKIEGSIRVENAALRAALSQVGHLLRGSPLARQD